MFVGEICTRDVTTCSGATTAKEMAETMRSEWLGDLVVTEIRGGETVPIGIVTDRDLVTRVMAMGRNANEVTASDIMSSPLITEYEGEDVQVAFHRLKHSHVRRIPLIDSAGTLVGVVSLADMAKLLDLRLSESTTPRDAAKAAVTD